MSIKENPNAKKAAIALFLVMGLFAWANYNSIQEAGGGAASRLLRFPASHMFVDSRSADPAVEKKYAVELAKKKERHLASVGHPASPLEDLRFGVLEGKYSFTMNGDKVQEIVFVDAPDSDVSPKQISDRVQFLTQFSGIFGVEGAPQRVGVDMKGEKIVETYKIHSKKGGADTIIQLTLDDSERLLTLRLEKSDLKIF